MSSPGWTHRVSLLATLLVVAASGPLLAAAGIPRATLTGHDDSMTRYESLRVHVATDGPNDVIVIGSSVVRRGVIPSIVEAAAVAEAGGEGAFRVYNFGVPGHSVLTYPVLTELVLGVDRPQLLVLVVTPRAIDAGVEHLRDWAEVVLTSSYGRALEDRWRLRGALNRWLLDHTQLPNRAPTLRAQLLGDPSSAERSVGDYDPARGFLPSKRRELTEHILERQSEIAREWATSPEHWLALERVARRASDAGVRVLLVDSPLRARLIELMRDPEHNLGGLRDFMERAQRTLGVQVAFAPRGMVPDEEFADLTHFDEVGAERYSRWLGTQIARRYPELAHRADAH